MKKVKIVSIPVSSILLHPDYPLLSAEISAKKIRSEMMPIVSFRKDGKPELLWGYDIILSLRKAGIEVSINCQIADIKDPEDRFFSLYEYNQQQDSNWSGVHIGLYALSFLEKYSRDKSLTVFAEKIGKTPQSVGQYVEAAKTFLRFVNLKLKFQISDITSRTKHLYVMHNLPDERLAEVWQEVVIQGLTVKEVEKLVLGKPTKKRKRKDRLALTKKHYEYFTDKLQEVINHNLGSEGSHVNLCYQALRLVAEIKVMEREIETTKPRNIIAWINKRGGIRVPENETLKGEIKELEEFQPSIKFYTNRKTRKGFPLDLLAVQAAEDGWIETEDIDLLLDAIKENKLHPDIGALTGNIKQEQKEIESLFLSVIKPQEREGTEAVQDAMDSYISRLSAYVAKAERQVAKHKEKLKEYEA